MGKMYQQAIFDLDIGEKGLACDKEQLFHSGRGRKLFYMGQTDNNCILHGSTSLILWILCKKYM